MGCLDQGIAFGGLLAVAKQAYPGLLHSQHPLRVLAAQLGELGQPFGSAVHLGTGVNQQRAARAGWEDGADGGPGDPGQTAQLEQGGGHGGAAVTGAEAGVGAARTQHPHRHRHAGSGLTADRLGGVGAHGNRLFRLLQGQSAAQVAHLRDQGIESL